MYYILGSSGILSKSITSVLNKKNYKIISRRGSQEFIKTNIFKKNLKKKNEIWMNKIKSKDTLLILSSLGSMKKYESDAEVKNFINSLKFILKKINKKIKIVFFSSDMVFDGEKLLYSDLSKTNPINNYGKTKKKIENFIKKNFKNFLILRLCKIYSKNIRDQSIYSEAYYDLKKNKKLNLFYDQKVHYMSIVEFKRIIKKILSKKNIKGTYNCPGSFFLSRYDFIKKMFPNKKKLMIKKSIKDHSYLPKRLKMNSKIFKYIGLNV